MNNLLKQALDDDREAEQFFSFADYQDRAIGRLCAIVVVAVLLAVLMGWL
jgi:hypothetical protein